MPFFLTAQEGPAARTARNPTMLYGYGGFSISVLPSYRSDVPAWLELGGVFVTVNMRGGAEYGEAWHKAGYLEKKQNVFDDFIAVAEYLVKEKLHLAGDARDHGRIERRPAGRRGDGTAARSVRRGAARGRRDGHAALRPVHRRPAVGHRVRIVIRPGAVRVPDQVLAAAQREARARAIRRRWSRPPITTIASCRATRSSSRRRCRRRRAATGRC